MFKHISGKQKGSARCRPYIPSLMPEERKIRNYIYPKSITDTIEKFHRDHNATSPNVKDDVKLKIGNRQYLKSRVIYRFETWAELWNTFQKFQAVIASIIANPEKPEDVPSIFRTSAPWELRKGTDTGCLCTTCENLEQIRRGQMTAVFLIKKHIEHQEEVIHEEEISHDYRFAKQIGLSKEKSILSVLSASSKFDMICRCLCPTQSNKSGLAYLEDIKKACLDQDCEHCGFSKYWSKGIRREIVDTEFGQNALISDNADEVWSETVQWRHYVSRPRPAICNFASQEIGDDDEYNSREGSTLRDLVLETKEGTLIDFLDDMEVALNKNIHNRVLLTNEYRAKQQFAQIRRPGMFSRDIDFSENGSLKNARELQSEHWTSIQYSLMVSVLSCIDAKEWDMVDGDLALGSEVTVYGEKSFENFEKNSFWGKVKFFHGDGKYEVVTAEGTIRTCTRNEMRKRVLRSLAVGGVSNDKLHDRHHQQHFTKRELKWFEEYLKINRPEDIGVGKVENPRISHLAQHMDNASQHFKSTGAIEFMTHLFEETVGQNSENCFIISFGCPGHGKGAWVRHIFSIVNNQTHFI